MLDAHVGGEKNTYDAAPERFFDQLDIILAEKKFPKPIVVVPVKSGLSVIDGNNRIAAHAYALSSFLPADRLAQAGGQLPSSTQQAWHGTHRDGEMLDE
jgi:hypothetical protein